MFSNQTVFIRQSLFYFIFNIEINYLQKFYNLYTALAYNHEKNDLANINYCSFLLLIPKQGHDPMVIGFVATYTMHCVPL